MQSILQNLPPFLCGVLLTWLCLSARHHRAQNRLRRMLTTQIQSQATTLHRLREAATLGAYHQFQMGLQAGRFLTTKPGP